MPETEQQVFPEPENFDWDALEAVVAACPGADYGALNSALGSASTDEDRPVLFKLGCLLMSKICFLHFDPSRRQVPYTPAIQLSDRRSFAIDDLAPEELAFLEGASRNVRRADLRGRVNDILWLTRRDLGVKTGLEAIQAYSELSLEDLDDYQKPGVVDCWDRALCLARLLRGAAETAIEPLESTISEELDRALREQNYIARELSSLSLRYGLDGDKRRDRAKALLSFADHLREQGGHHAERVFLAAALDWVAAEGRDEAYWEIVEKTGTSHELDADQEEQTEKPSYVRIASILEQAIQCHRMVPRQYRKPGFEQHLVELRQRHAEAGARAVEEFSVFESDPIDLSELAAEAKARVSGKSILVALFELCLLFPIPKRDELLEAERKALAGGSIAGIFSRSTLGEDGRVIAKVPAADAKNSEDVILIRAIENYVRFLEVLVKGVIVPALDALNQEHCIREKELMPLVAESPAIPPGRERFFAKGLAAGFDWDFMNSAHLLIPQIENFLRYHIKGRGGDTTVMSPEGIQTEASMSTLLEMKETLDILGPNITFLFDVLLVNSHGVNFRNRQAHGLIGGPTAEGPHSVFVWWLCLHLVILPFWSSGKNKSDSPPE